MPKATESGMKTSQQRIVAMVDELMRWCDALEARTTAAALLEFEVRSGVSAERRHLKSPEKIAALGRDAATLKVYPALSDTRYPGSGVEIIFNPNGVASPFYRNAATLSGGIMILVPVPKAVAALQPWAG
jgi:hypothetical protein